jgi:hypothetical protein
VNTGRFNYTLNDCLINAPLLGRYYVFPQPHVRQQTYLRESWAGSRRTGRSGWPSYYSEESKVVSNLARLDDKAGSFFLHGGVLPIERIPYPVNPSKKHVDQTRLLLFHSTSTVERVLWTARLPWLACLCIAPRRRTRCSIGSERGIAVLFKRRRGASASAISGSEIVCINLLSAFHEA